MTFVSQEFKFVEAIPMATFDSASITGAFQALNGTGTADDVKILRIVNASTQPVEISWDGTNEHDVILAGEPAYYDFQANASNVPDCGTKYVRKGQILYGRGTAGVGNIYIAGYR